MNKIKNLFKNIDQAFLISFAINLVVLFFFLLFWEPTTKSDDYDATVILYGGLDGNYSPIMLYSNVIYGKILVFLLNLCPSIAWYSISQYILLFISNTLLGKLLYNNKKTFIIPYVIFSFFWGYEFYIRLTFSKTAGYLIIVGYISFLVYITISSNLCHLLCGYVLVFFGTIIRNGILTLITFLFISSFILYTLNRNKRSIKGILLFIVISISTIIGNNMLYNYSYDYMQNDSLWKTYIKTNSARASLVDYGLPSYNNYQDEYEALGVSYNDYTFWFNYAIRGDNDLLTTDLYKKIAAIRENNSSNLYSKIISSFKHILHSFFSNTMFWLFLLIIIFFINAERYFIRYSITIFSFSLTATVILYVLGRTQHHIDALIFICASIQLLYYIAYSEQRAHDDTIKPITAVLILTIICILNFYEEISNSSYYADRIVESEYEKKDENYYTLEKLSNDKDHFYVVIPPDTSNIYSCFNVFTPIEKNFYSNIYKTNMCHLGVHEKTKQLYNIDNIWNECTDSPTIRFIFSSDSLYKIDAMQTYINEHYNANAIYTLERTVDNISIYKFISN